MLFLYKYIFLFILLLFTVTISYGSKYSSRIQTEYKAGNTRSIIRPAVLIPVYQVPNSLIYISLIGMSDTKSALEGNFGIGWRNLINNNIYGIYGFYDIRRTSYGNIIHQATIGAEWFKEFFELRFNVYLPSQKVFRISDISRDIGFRATGSGLSVDRVSSYKIEQAVPGFDIDIGTQLPSLPNLTVRGAYYHFMSPKRNVSSRIGFRGTIGYKINEYLQLDAEFSYDNQRKFVYFGGVTVGYSFGKNSTRASGLTRLEKKMTSIPIRDIDAVVGQGTDNKITDSINYSGLEKGEKLLFANEENQELLLVEIINNQVVVHKSTANNENQYIIDLLKKYANRNVLNKKNIKFGILKNNELVKIDQLSSESNKKRFINVANSTLPSIDNFDLKDTAKNLRDITNKLTRELNDKKETINDLNNKLAEAEINSSKKESELSDSINKLKKEIKDLNNTSASEKKDMQESLDDLKRELNNNFENNEKEKNRLNNEIANLENKINEAESLANMKEKILNERISFFKQELTKTKDESVKNINNISQKLDFAQKQLEQSKINADSKQREYTKNLNEVNASLAQEKIESNKQKKELESKIKSLNDSLIENSMNSEQKEKELNANIKKLQDNLKSNQNKSNVDKDKMIAEIDRLNNELTRVVDISNTKEKKLTNDIKDLRDALQLTNTQASRKQASLENDILQLNKQRVQDEQKNKLSNNFLMRDIDSLKKQLQSSKEKNVRIEKERDELKNNLAQLNQNLADSKKFKNTEIESLKKELQSTKQEVVKQEKLFKKNESRLNSDIKASKKLMKKSQQQFLEEKSQLKNEITRLNKKLKANELQYTKEKNTLEKRIQTLNRNMTEIKHSRNKSLNDLKLKENELKILKEDNLFNSILDDVDSKESKIAESQVLELKKKIRVLEAENRQLLQEQQEDIDAYQLLQKQFFEYKLNQNTKIPKRNSKKILEILFDDKPGDEYN
ncbi:MAG: inverse autotransporter beta domain-containing protein [Legionellales bacterium]|nr:inverse autotransporter beta domain-containing protein [Legionellales bacterium]